MNVKRNSNGQFKKGVSGNVKGRPKKKAVVDKYLKSKAEDLGGNSYDVLKSLLRIAVEKNDTEEAKDISKMLIGFEKARYQNIESDENKISEIKVTWEEPEAPSSDHPMYKLVREQSLLWKKKEEYAENNG